MTGFKQFRLEGIGTVCTTGGSSNVRISAKCGYDFHPYMKQEFWLNPANQFWNSSLYSEESRIDLAKRANVTYL